MKKISIVVPMYNEEKTIRKTIKTLLEMPFPLELKKEIVVVNDASTDDSLKILNKFANQPQLIILNNSTNLGKTESVRKGIMASAGDLVVIQDADDEYYPYDLIRMSILMLSDDSIDAVYGNRFHKRNKNKGINYIGNKVLTAISNFFTLPYGLYVQDMEVCYKMLKGDLFRTIATTFESQGFGMEPETTAKLAKLRAKVVNTDINYFPRSSNEGKKLNAAYDGYQALIVILYHNIFADRKSLRASYYETQR